MKRIFVISLFLVACDNGPNFAKLCEENPEICQEFTEDSWCKKERINIGFANLEQKQDPKDINQFNQLVAYEAYEKCVSHASKIEHIKLKEKTTRRVNNMIKARERIKEISEETRNSDHPRLLYFHWTRYMDEAALEKFLSYEGSSELETPESQFELATYYAKRDPQKTIGVLFHALELHQEPNPINPEVFKSLSSIFTDKEKYKQGYIWLKVLSLYSPDDKDLTTESLSQYSTFYNLDAAFLDKAAELTLEKIREGNFTAPKY